MKKTLADRLAFLIADLGIKQLDFARKIHFTQSYVSMVLSGVKTNPSARFLQSICREFSINPEWLKSGKGEIYVIPGMSLPQSDAEIMAKFRLLPLTDQQTIEEIINAFLLKTMASKDKTGN
ncbi:MAG: helix-turn-helix domain-containing protein [Treponema sp.]|nr:helix-turn-helix domain-containing protein [Treponema sp.]